MFFYWNWEEHSGKNMFVSFYKSSVKIGKVCLLSCAVHFALCIIGFVIEESLKEKKNQHDCF